MTYRVSVYELAGQSGRRFYSEVADMNEHQAAQFMEHNESRHRGRFVAVISEQRSVGQTGEAC